MTSEGATGTRWIYLKIPAVSGEWHPFSLCDDGTSVLITTAGDWSEKLHAACVIHRQVGLPVQIDGVYGSVSPAWRPYSRVLLIGGGVGVAPWLPLMAKRP